MGGIGGDYTFFAMTVRVHTGIWKEGRVFKHVYSSTWFVVWSNCFLNWCFSEFDSNFESFLTDQNEISQTQIPSKDLCEKTQFQAFSAFRGTSGGWCLE